MKEIIKAMAAGGVPLMQITRDWKALLRLHFLYASVSSGLLAALGRPRTREELLADLGVERPELLDALLEVGLSLGEVGYKSGCYRLTGRRARALREDKYDALAAMVEANVTYYNSVFRGFSDRMRGGELDEGVGLIGSLVARISKISDPYLKHFLQSLVKKRGPLRILDVGCGSGLHLRTAAEANPGVRGIGLDVDPDVVRDARKNLAAWGLSDRVQVDVGDIRAWPSATAEPFDLVLLLSVIYYFQEDERIGVLRSLRGHLGPGGVLALVTSCRGPGSDSFSANLNLATSSMSGLSPLPRAEEMEEQMTAAGFQQVLRKPLIPGTTYFGFLAS